MCTPALSQHHCVSSVVSDSINYQVASKSMGPHLQMESSLAALQATTCLHENGGSSADLYMSSCSRMLACVLEFGWVNCCLNTATVQVGSKFAFACTMI